MYKITTFTYSMLVVFLSCVLWGCNDEPNISMDILDPEVSLDVTIPYGYSDIALTYACSEQYLDIIQPKFLIIKNDGTTDIIIPDRKDFKLSQEKTTVSLKGTTENIDESVNQEMTSYQYTFNVRIEGDEGTFLVFAFGAAKEDVSSESLLAMIKTPGASIFRGFCNWSMTAHCVDGQFSISSDPQNLNNVSGYLVENSVENLYLAVSMVADYIPTYGFEYTPAEGNQTFIPFDIKYAGSADMPVSVLEDYIGSHQKANESRGSFDFLLTSGAIDCGIIPLIKQYAEK